MGYLTDFVHEPTNFRFMSRWDVDVLDGTTADANEVVVMAGDPLCEFVSGQALSAKVRNDDASLLEYRERAIER